MNMKNNINHDIFTPNQLAQILGLNKNKAYSDIKEWSIFLSRKLLFFIECHIASMLIKSAICKSPATLSRLKITINVDDTSLLMSGLSANKAEETHPCLTYSGICLMKCFASLKASYSSVTPLWIHKLQNIDILQ